MAKDMEEDNSSSWHLVQESILKDQFSVYDMLIVCIPAETVSHNDKLQLLPIPLNFVCYICLNAKLDSCMCILLQVTYLNHKHFGATQKKPKPSPVRIFTNLSLPGFRLPAKEGYHMCKTCNRYIAKFNSHCEKCGTCTSKVATATI